jgi:hypothetical protein
MRARSGVAIVLVGVAALVVGGPASCAARAPGPDWMTGNCEADRVATIQKVVSATDQYRGPCSSVADCTRIEARISCQGGPLVSIAQSNAAAWALEQANLEAEICPFLGECSVAVDSELGTVSCVAERCVLLVSSLDAGP